MKAVRLLELDRSTAESRKRSGHPARGSTARFPASLNVPNLQQAKAMRRFDSFRLDPLNQCLWRGEQRVAITPKAFDMLRYLVEHPGRLVTHEEMLEALWPETYVNQEVVKKYIQGIRKVLGDRHDQPTFIETLPRRGYQFVAQVIEESSAGPSALRMDGENKIVGRGAALAGLASALDRALRGQRQVIFVTGEAGIGKTTLVDVFHRHAA